MNSLLSKCVSGALFVTALPLLALPMGCTTGSSQAPVVASISRETLQTDKKSVLGGNSASVKVNITLNKENLFNQEFLYGADLQYSSFYDKSSDLYVQSAAIGHIPVHFRQVGSELQLVADNRRLFQSDVNHPEQLISRFQIISETATQLVVTSMRSDTFLAQIYEGTHGDTDGGLFSKDGKPPRDLWVRSFDFDPKGNYLLQQTSIEAQDGSVGEFMESVFPRANLAPGVAFQKFEMDPANPIGSDDGLINRFRFLPGEKIFQGEKAVAFAQHFDLSPQANGAPKTLDFYVTGNVPTENLKPLALAVEGWNRYFRTYKGIARDVLKFKGALPEGIHLGDPRYNVINWDSRQVAGAAYESQATDPETGVQSHSLIYLPAAWLKIGTGYWKDGQFSESEASGESVSPQARLNLAGALRNSRVACLRDVKEASALLSSGRLGAEEVKTFSIELLKNVLFHEVGHSLGLHHNFKGSLSFDRKDPQSVFSTSIMDYNDYEIERKAFAGIDSADGPLLAYDRQALSAIYNKFADVGEKEPVLPACNDAEADSESGGVDPLCNRYDSEKDPTLAVDTTINRVALEAIPGDVTLAQAIAKVPGLVFPSGVTETVKTEEEFKSLLNRFTSALRGPLNYYVLGGKTSMNYVIKKNVKTLYEYENGVLPEGYSAREMRQRAYRGIETAVHAFGLPETVSKALNQAQVTGLRKLSETPYVASLSAPDQDKLGKAVAKQLGALEVSFNKSTSGMPKLRASVLASLSRHPVPFFFGKMDNVSADFEALILDLLVEAAGAKDTRTPSERMAAAGALVTYKGRLKGDLALQTVLEKLGVERKEAFDNTSRDLVEGLIQLLGGLKN